MNLVHSQSQSPESLSESVACKVLAVSRSAAQRHRYHREFVGPPKPRQYSRQHSNKPRVLSPQERQNVLDTLNSDEYCEQPPMQVYYALLSRGTYLCSISTMHRILHEHLQHGERRRQRPKQHNADPRLCAKVPNEVWTWDITKLATKKRGEYFSLYVVMDLYSRYIFAWILSYKENSALAQQLMQEAVTRYTIEPGHLTLRQDRGAPITAHGYLDLLGGLAITASHSRPRVSNHNPYSKSLFKTAKYQPDFPRRFDNLGHANNWCEEFVQWYNYSHHYSNLAGNTPHQVFSGESLSLHCEREKVLHGMHESHTERLVNGKPQSPIPPQRVTINPYIDEEGHHDPSVQVNFPTLNRVKSKLTSA